MEVMACSDTDQVFRSGDKNDREEVFMQVYKLLSSYKLYATRPILCISLSTRQSSHMGCSLFLGINSPPEVARASGFVGTELF